MTLLQFFSNLLLLLGVRQGVKEQNTISCAAGLAQSVERLTAEREVVGSIHWAGPILRVVHTRQQVAATCRDDTLHGRGEFL